MNWNTLLVRLKNYPINTHITRPPISVERLDEVQQVFERLPEPLLAMVEHFNGAELFMRGIPFLTLFGLSEDPPLDELEWAEDWYIDKFTPKWRKAGEDRESQFAIGMMNYGGLVLYEDGLIKEWDTAVQDWSPSEYTLGEWLEKILEDGDTMLRELDEG